MKIKKTYDAESDIPAEVASLYEERDGKWHLTLNVESAANADDVIPVATCGSVTLPANEPRAVCMTLLGRLCVDEKAGGPGALLAPASSYRR